MYLDVPGCTCTPYIFRTRLATIPDRTTTPVKRTLVASRLSRLPSLAVGKTVAVPSEPCCSGQLHSRKQLFSPSPFQSTGNFSTTQLIVPYVKMNDCAICKKKKKKNLSLITSFLLCIKTTTLDVTNAHSLHPSIDAKGCTFAHTHSLYYYHTYSLGNLNTHNLRY